MINRRRPQDNKHPAIIVTSSSGGSPLKGNRGRVRKQKASLYLRVAFLVPVFILVGILLRMVDFGFLGGVFLTGLQLKLPADDNDDGREDATTITTNFPDGWEYYSYNDIRDHFDCRSRSKDNEKPLPTMKDWRFMRQTFTKVVDNTKRWDDPVPPTLGYSLERDIPYPPPYYAKFSPGKGRGLFASRDIDEGELVHDGTVSDVIFPNALAWRRFIFSLPREMACDSTDWHWMQKLEEDGPYYLLAGMNISSLMNSGGEEFGPGRMPNTLCTLIEYFWSVLCHEGYCQG